jgi:polysaccharide biosynthesis/export protein PslD
MKLAHLPQKGNWYPGLLACLLILTVCGCQSYAPAVPPDQMFSEPANQQVLAAGDVVDIKFLYNSELNDTQRVRPDGKVNMQLIGDVVARGKTPEALQEELNRLYADQLRKPEVTVTAKTVRNNKVYVGGEVMKPGDVEIPGQLTAFEAISQAGGFNTKTADTSSVVVVRREHGKQFGTVVNFDAALAGKEVQPYYLRAGDIVYVPQTRIAKVDQWVEQHISGLLPRVPVSFAP